MSSCQNTEKLLGIPRQRNFLDRNEKKRNKKITHTHCKIADEFRTSSRARNLVLVPHYARENYHVQARVNACYFVSRNLIESFRFRRSSELRVGHSNALGIYVIIYIFT